LGGEELSLSVRALILAGAGFLFHLSSVSAQEIPHEVLPIQENILSAEDRLRAAEQSLRLEENEAAAQAAGPSIWAALRMVLILILAAAAIYGVVFFLKRSAKQTSVNNPFLKILATSHLGSNRYAHIVAVGNRAWLLGSSDGGVSLVGEIDDKDILNAMMLEDSKKSEQPQGRFPDFLAMLRRFGASVEEHPTGAEDIRRRRERLKGL